MKNKSNNYKDGRSLKKYYCTFCHKIITWQTYIYGSKLCKTCSHIDNNEHYCCINCEKKVSRKGVLRCAKCYGIWERGKNHPNYKHGLTHNNKCIDCGITISYRSKRCYSCESKGERSNFYIHGKGCSPYSKEFTKNLKESIKQRDNCKCQNCNILEIKHLKIYKKTLHIHHIDYNKNNCSEKNLITLCHRCNLQANQNRKYWIKFYKKLIKIIYTS